MVPYVYVIFWAPSVFCMKSVLKAIPLKKDHSFLKPLNAEWREPPGRVEYEVAYSIGTLFM